MEQNQAIEKIKLLIRKQAKVYSVFESADVKAYVRGLNDAIGIIEHVEEEFVD